jgi:hypothetical protein
MLPLAIRLAGAAVILATLSLAGCNRQPIYPVSGVIVGPDGSPITTMPGAAIEFESVDFKASANSSIDDKGAFRLTTASPGDGAYLGKHRVAIIRPYIGPENRVPHVIDPKYESFETSGLQIDVEPKSNDIKITVELYKKK